MFDVIPVMVVQPLHFVMAISCLTPVALVDVKPQQEKYFPDYRFYHNLTSLEQHVEDLAFTFKDFFQIKREFQSRNGLSQLVTHITNFSVPSTTLASYHSGSPHDVPHRQSVRKIRILFSFGEHAREFFPIESFLHLMENLTDGLSASPESYAHFFSRKILSQFDIYTVVIANPDGRKYVETSHNFCWRGTSTGVDINRNFDWQFANRGSSSNPADEEFRGPSAFSEPESHVYMELTKSLQFDVFVSFHSGARHIYLPFADTKSRAVKRKPPNFSHLSKLAARLAASTKYSFHHGQAFDLNFYTADGTAFDYMAGVRRIPFSLAIEMWENERHKGRSCFDEFNPRSDQLQEEVEAFHPLYVELFNYLSFWKSQQHPTHSKSQLLIETPSLTFSFVLLAVVVMVSLIFGYRNRNYICSKKRRIVYLRSLSTTFDVGGVFR